jgi:hypothetical protein
MLCQFTFENFKSFKNETTLDLYAEKISEHEDSLIIDKNDQEAFLPVIVIYGPNGGGKSSVLEAFIYLINSTWDYFIEGDFICCVMYFLPVFVDFHCIIRFRYQVCLQHLIYDCMPQNSRKIRLFWHIKRLSLILMLDFLSKYNPVINYYNL